MKILKFGGTSVQDAEAIKRVRRIVGNRREEGLVVVVSAMARVTRLLGEVADEAALGHSDRVYELIKGLEDRHLKVAYDLLGECLQDLEAAEFKIQNILDGLLAFVSEACRRRSVSDSDRAYILSAGELMSSELVAAELNSCGINCRLVDARNVVTTDSNYLAARPDLEVTSANARKYLSDFITWASGKEIILTQGFIAKTLDGESAVLGFEGSDYSAAIFGMSLDAERVEIWTDVDGIRTADPRVVSDTQRIAKVSYDEAALMASCGARVLHPMTMDPARRKNIPVYVLNTMNPEGEGSVVCGETSDGPKSIAFSTEDRQADGTVKISVVGKNAIRVADIVREVAGSDISASDDVLSFNIPCDTASKVANELHRKLFPAEQK